MSVAKRLIVFFLHAARSADWLAPLLMRLFFGYFWMINGWGKIHDLSGFTHRFAGWGIPHPYLSAVFSACTELIGGTLIFIGLFTRLAALPLMFNMLVAIVMVTSKQMQGLNDFVLSDEPLYILVLFWLFIAGPGRASLDSLLRSALGIDAELTGLAPTSKASPQTRRASGP